jgi:hypothetical protein
MDGRIEVAVFLPLGRQFEAERGFLFRNALDSGAFMPKSLTHREPDLHRLFHGLRGTVDRGLVFCDHRPVRNAGKELS